MAVIGFFGVGALLAENPGLVATTPRAMTGDPYGHIVERLEALVGTQDDATLEALRSDRRPAELLVDEDGRVIAGYYVNPLVDPQVIADREPGCTTGDACAFNGSDNGWYGTGRLEIRIDGVTRITAGDRATAFWRGETAEWLAPGKSINHQVARDYTSITRD